MSKRDIKPKKDSKDEQLEGVTSIKQHVLESKSDGYEIPTEIEKKFKRDYR